MYIFRFVRVLHSAVREKEWMSGTKKGPKQTDIQQENMFFACSFLPIPSVVAKLAVAQLLMFRQRFWIWSENFSNEKMETNAAKSHNYKIWLFANGHIGDKRVCSWWRWQRKRNRKNKVVYYAHLCACSFQLRSTKRIRKLLTLPPKFGSLHL